MTGEHEHDSRTSKNNFGLTEIESPAGSGRRFVHADVAYIVLERLRASLEQCADRQCNYGVRDLRNFAREALDKLPQQQQSETGGIECIHCRGAGHNDEPVTVNAGEIEFADVRCDTCGGTGRIRTVEQYLKTLPADWHEDSSLEKWFPITAEELKRAKDERDRLHRQLLEHAEVCGESAYPLSERRQQETNSHQEGVASAGSSAAVSPRRDPTLEVPSPSGTSAATGELLAATKTAIWETGFLACAELFERGAVSELREKVAMINRRQPKATEPQPTFGNSIVEAYGRDGQVGGEKT